MSTVHSTSIRLSQETLALLDKSARKTKRSRSVIIEEALKRHLPALEAAEENAAKLERLLSFKGAGTNVYGPLTPEEINRRARDFRGDEE